MGKPKGPQVGFEQLSHLSLRDSEPKNAPSRLHAATALGWQPPQTTRLEPWKSAARYVGSLPDPFSSL